MPPKKTTPCLPEDIGPQHIKGQKALGWQNGSNICQFNDICQKIFVSLYIKGQKALGWQNGSNTRQTNDVCQKTFGLQHIKGLNALRQINENDVNE